LQKGTVVRYIIARGMYAQCYLFAEADAQISQHPEGKDQTDHIG